MGNTWKKYEILLSNGERLTDAKLQEGWVNGIARSMEDGCGGGLECFFDNDKTTIINLRHVISITEQ